MAIDPPARWRLRFGKSHAFIKQTRHGSARDVLTDFLFPYIYRTADHAPTADEALYWDESGILQLLDTGLPVGAVALGFDDIIYLAPAVVGGGAAQAITVAATAAGGGSAGVTVAETVTVTSTATVGRFGSATAVASTVTVTATGVVGKVGNATSVAETVTLTASGNVATFGDASRSESVTITATGTNSVTGSATALPVTVQVDAVGTKYTNDYSLFWFDDGLLLLSDSTGSGTAATPWLADELYLQRSTGGGANDVATTVSIITTGTVGVAGAASAVSESVTIDASGGVYTNEYGLFWFDDGLLLLSDATGVQVSGTPWLADELFLQRGTSAGAVVSVAVTATTTGNVQTGSSASTVAETVTVASSATVGKVAAATAAATTVTVTAAGSVTVTGNSALSVTVTGTASGSTGIPVTGNATAPFTVTLTASGAVATPLDVSVEFRVGTSGDGTVTVNYTYYRVSEPKVQDYWNRNILMGRYGTDTGVSILVKNGVVSFVQTPMDVELEAADWYVLGGRDDRITESQAQDLINAGYGSLLEMV